MIPVENKIIKVLLIEDNAGDARLIQEQLKEISEATFQLEHASELQDGLTYLANHEIDIVLSDLSLPDSPGLETFKRLQTEVSGVPVIVLTGFDNKSVALQAVRDGAQDYLIKGQVEGKTLSRLIQYAIERYRTQANLRSLSLTDVLTGLYNRRGFITLGEQALKSARRNKTPLCLFFADVDGLKQINDTFGHKEGDQAILHTAQVLRKTFRDSDILSRLGGDEFVILATPDRKTQPEHVMSRLQENLKQHNLGEKKGYQLSLSIGMSQFDPLSATSMEELLAKADEVLYSQKKERKGLIGTRVHKKARQLIIGLVASLPILLFLLRWDRRKPQTAIFQPPRTVVLPSHQAVVGQVSSTPPRLSQLKVPQTEAIKKVSPPAAQKPFPSGNEIHKELIPKDIAIVRFSYGQHVMPPGTTFGFDINGSGFTSEFHKNLAVTPGALGLQTRNLRLVTANQIHGDIVVASEAATQYVFPRVLLNQHPVFQAPQPFAVIRPGEVLDVLFTSLDEDGRGGRFRIFTNFDSKMAKQFRVRASAPGLEISALQPHPPFVMEGTLRLSEGVDHGDYDLVVTFGAREVFRKVQMLHIVGPNLGHTGLIQSLAVAERYHRPGDNVELFLQGSGFTSQDLEVLRARVDEIDMGAASFTFISPSRLGVYFKIPEGVAEGSYGVIIEQNHQLLFRQKAAFTVVPANWIAQVELAPVRPGEKGLLRLTGRDFSSDGVRRLRVQAEDPGIHISNLHRQDASTLAADVNVEPSVAPGDYLLGLTFEGVSIKLPGGNLITISAP